MSIDTTKSIKEVFYNGIKIPLVGGGGASAGLKSVAASFDLVTVFDAQNVSIALPKMLKSTSASATLR